jgi:plastocyanin
MATACLALLLASALLLLVPAAGAVHFYRGPGGGCTPADGALGQAPTGMGAQVWMLHTSFLDLRTGTPVTIIAAGESVTWHWASAHCHSAFGPDWTTGFHYPVQAPPSPQVLPGLFDHPAPTTAPTLSATRTFDAPGVYTYACEHHQVLGMVGVVVVQ